MATLLVKSLCIGGGLVGLTTAVAGAYYLTSENPKIEETTPKTNEEKAISEWLKEDGKTLLNDDAKEDWKANWTKFKEGKQKTQALTEPWKLTDWENEFDKVDAPASLKEKCKQNEKIKINDKADKRYTDLVKYCTKQTE